MQGAMDRLAGLLERRRRGVVGVWALLLGAPLPFPSRHTHHLPGGGFSAPGSGSNKVDRALDRFEDAKRGSLAVVLAQRPGASAADVRAAVERADRAAARVPHVELSQAAEERAKRQAGSTPIVV